MAAENITNALVAESGRINYDIYRRTVYTDPFLTLPKKVGWSEAMGEEYSNIMWERPYVQTENEWADMGMNEGSTNSCIPPVDTVEFSQTLRTMKLKHKAVESNPFCVTDMLYVGKREAQMDAVQKGLAEQVRLNWISWNRKGFEYYSNKIILEPGLASTDESDGDTWDETEPTSILTNGALDYFYNLLILEQGHQHALSYQNGRPVFGLITDQLTSRSLKLANDSIREDFRYGKPEELLKPLGVSYTYNGFVHLISDAPRRYDFVAGNAAGSKWVERPHYTLSGGKLIVNPAWLTAEYQDSYLYVKDAFRLLVPPSINSVAKAKFDPQKYMADFTFLNVINVDKTSAKYNPDGKLGFFRGVMASGYEPINPHIMFTIRHKVCPPAEGLGLQTCPTV